MAGDDVVQRQVVRLPAAVLAGMPIAGEDLAPAELDPGAGAPDLVLEPDHRRGVVLGAGRPDHLVVVLDDLGLLTEHEPERPRQVADVEGFVILVQDEHDAVHRGRTIARTARRAGIDRIEAVARQARAVAAPVAGSQPPAWPTFVVSGLPSASATKRAARRTPSRDAPWSTPIASRKYTRSSVARLPAAPGAYGHPPVPPVEASNV